ncbi:hypothetical protein HDC36_000881 [Xanthomonas sp. JAI131]|uniref:hypothetical protein n=1 Tax=Xanthomonas sp. JAI131 TaxID=2723067 RepID=UPI0015C778ED|nr:hypothetical protein [Xanthomonas sp. JAI131]NYF19444.1 hypothetical protein [Xanthomonas sp. JAI131]
MSCKHDCPRPPLFPRTLDNRPGLPRIDYRIGRYPEVRAHLFERLNAAPALSAWTHREVDDPGIALLEADAVVIDILTFYQSLYANEAWLRTAQLRESVADLVRLGGYRLAPGVGGEATFALKLKGSVAVSVPLAFGLKAQIQGSDKPVDFETDAALDALPALSEFSLYRPQAVPALSAGASVLCVDDPGLPIKPRDRLLVGQPLPEGAANARIADAQIVEVEASWVEFDRTHIQLKTPLRRATPIAKLRAFPLGDSLRHFGHNAPETIAAVSAQGVPSQRAISFARLGNATTSADVAPALAANEFALDRSFDRIQPGDSVLVQGRFAASAGGAGQRITLLRRVSEAESRSLRWGSNSGASSVLGLAQDLLASIGASTYPYLDVRTLSLLQVSAPAFDVHAPPLPTAAAQGDLLGYFGTAAAARALRGRRLLFAHADGRVDERVVQTTISPPAGPDPTREAWHRVRLSAPVRHGDFDVATPSTRVFGNVVAASQGKTVELAAIGSGDARVAFHSVPLPKSPLTYRFEPTHQPAQVPALEIFVDGTRWRQVDTLFDAAPGDRVYIVREDAEGQSVVQFGDGITGARAPSGRDNIQARYRTGIAAHGALKPDTQPQATGKLTGLDKVFLPGPVDTGAPAESADNARRAAPVRLQSLGRLVSLADHEAEALMLPNVVKAGARWDAPDGVPAVVLTVLTASGNDADLAAVREALAGYQRCRGAGRHPLRVLRGERRYVYLHAQVAHDGSRETGALARDLQRALGVAGLEADGMDARDGLFGLDRRDFHAAVHGSEVIAALQGVDGVLWVRLLAAMALPTGSPPQADPSLLPLPAVDVIPAAAIACPPRALLALHARHLRLSLTLDIGQAECAS